MREARKFSVLVPHQRRQGENVKLLDGLLYWGLSQRGAKKKVKNFIVGSLDLYCMVLSIPQAPRHGL